MRTQPITYIISAQLASLSEGVNKTRTDALRRELEDRGLNFKQVQGKYKDNEEDSFVVVQSGNNELRSLLEELASDFEQESILLIDANRAAWLLYSSGEDEYIGKWEAATREIAQQQEGYTYCPVLNQHYIVRA